MSNHAIYIVVTLVLCVPPLLWLTEWPVELWHWWREGRSRNSGYILPSD